MDNTKRSVIENAITNYARQSGASDADIRSALDKVPEIEKMLRNVDKDVLEQIKTSLAAKETENLKKLLNTYGGSQNYG